MEKIILNPNQSKELAKSVCGEIRSYCDTNFGRFITQYREELINAKVSPIEPITIKFTPMPYLTNDNPTESGGDCNG